MCSFPCNGAQIVAPELGDTGESNTSHKHHVILIEAESKTAHVPTHSTWPFKCNYIDPQWHVTREAWSLHSMGSGFGGIARELIASIARPRYCAHAKSYPLGPSAHVLAGEHRSKFPQGKLVICVYDDSWLWSLMFGPGSKPDLTPNPIKPSSENG